LHQGHDLQMSNKEPLTVYHGSHLRLYIAGFKNAGRGS
jgi:hypothetical protein